MKFASLFVLALPLALAAEPAPTVDFNRDVRPILSGTCFKCHGPDEAARKGELRLDLREAALRPAESGDVPIVPGKPDASEAVRRVFSTDPDEAMPPPKSKMPLTDAQKKTLRDWIAGGAEYTPHWAWIAPRLGVPPMIQQTDWPRNPIDRLVLARLEAEGLAPSPEADPQTLCRRVSLDLTGLPPTPAEADAFANDKAPGAYERLVERLLASPRYGERWARRWLDLARYADTNGYEKDRTRHVWPYRDWVIRALNADMPFDQFTTEQLAGDLLPDVEKTGSIAEADPHAATPAHWLSESKQDRLIATGFHRNTMLNEEGGIDPLEFRFQAVVDRVSTTGTAWLGLTVGCAQCHTHKYDPLLHTEYYGLMAFLNNADEPDLDLTTPDAEAAQARNLAAAEKLVAGLPEKWPLPAAPPPDETGETLIAADAASPEERRRDALESAFAAWLAAERGRAVAWIALRPAEMRSTMPQLTLQPDGSIFASGDITKEDRYDLRFSALPAGVTAVRIEALPDDRLPAHGPGMAFYEGPKGDFCLSDFHVIADDGEVRMSGATESYAKDKFVAKNAIDDNRQTGWACSDRPGQAQQAVFTLAAPRAAEGAATMTLEFARHYAAPLGRFRISVTTDPRGAAARDFPSELETLLTRPDAALTAGERQALRECFLLTAPELAAETKKIAALRKASAAPTALVFRERPPEYPRPTFLHHRGEFLQTRQRIEPGVPAFLPALPPEAPRNRLGLARWLVSPENPLTARVAVNRAWQAFFGDGLVRTMGDFGLQGDPPTNPELLDWLAITFIQEGWSMKALHRTIVTSATYRQSSRVTPERLARDPQNRLLSRGPRVRLEGEMVRDAALRASGLLSEKMFGPPVRPPQAPGVSEVAYGAPKWDASAGEDRYRRAIYTLQKRTAPFAMLNTFDAPTGEVCVARRENSNTPLQALTLLNDENFVEAARTLGTQAAAGPGGDTEKAAFIFRRCLTRLPRPAELDRLLAFLQTQRARLAAGELRAADLAPGNKGDPAERAAWTTLARAVLNLDEAITKN